jgi:hypothetical protein
VKEKAREDAEKKSDAQNVYSTHINATAAENHQNKDPVR